VRESSRIIYKIVPFSLLVCGGLQMGLGTGSWTWKRSLGPWEEHISLPLSIASSVLTDPLALTSESSSSIWMASLRHSNTPIKGNLTTIHANAYRFDHPRSNGSLDKSLHKARLTLFLLGCYIYISFVQSLQDGRNRGHGGNNRDDKDPFHAHLQGTILYSGL
jgi:hypothetical protein